MNIFTDFNLTNIITELSNPKMLYIYDPAVKYFGK
jgi:hypothetical protein